MMMRGRTAAPLLLVAALILTMFLASACGRKGPPIPLRETAPAAITDLRYELDNGKVTLLWSYPAVAANGKPLDGIERFEVLQAEVAEADYCPGCPLNFNRALIVDDGSADRKKTGRCEISDLRTGYRYFFKVRSIAGWQRMSGDSNVISLQWPQTDH